MTPQVNPFPLPEGYTLYRRNGDYSLWYFKRMVEKWEKKKPTEADVTKAVEEYETRWGQEYTPQTSS